jgi:uncharacterized RDD family membrane protein YckC
VDVLDLIETPENVELEQRLAGIGSRFMAGVIDGLILTGMSIAVFIVFSALSMLDPFEAQLGLGTALFAVAIFLLFWGYFVFFEYRTNGQTPGKKTMRIRVVREGGMPITFRDVAVRNLLRIVDSFPSMIISVIGGVVMFATKKCQRLGDLAAGTVVVSEQPVDYSAKSDRRVTAEWEADAGAAALRATGLTPEEYRVLSNYWMRRGELTLEARYNVLPKLLAPILARSGQALADGRLETLEAYVELLMRQAWYAENEERARQYQQYQQQYNQGRWP